MAKIYLQRTGKKPGILQIYPVEGNLLPDAAAKVILDTASVKVFQSLVSYEVTAPPGYPDSNGRVARIRGIAALAEYIDAIAPDLTALVVLGT